MTKHTRYKLHNGKFGYYFYDSKTNTNMTLEKVLNRLNHLDKELTNSINRYNKLSTENILLRKVK